MKVNKKIFLYGFITGILIYLILVAAGFHF